MLRAASQSQSLSNRSGWDGQHRCDIPRQELVNPIDRMISDVREHMAQPGLRINAIELGGADQRIDCCGPFPTAVGAGKEIIAPTNGNPTQCPFGSRIVDLNDPVIAIARECRPQIQGIHDRCGGIGFT